MRFACSLVLLTLTSAGILAAPLASNTFNAGAEGWLGVTTNLDYVVQLSGLALTHAASGGNPGGYVSILDPSSDETFLSAPAAYLGNQLGALGGTLRYDTISNLAPTWDGADVVIVGNGVVLVYDIPVTIGAAWSSFVVSLAPGANWRVGTTGGAAATMADFQTALVNLSGLYITAETVSGVIEVNGLDNVSLWASEVPEPSAMGLLLAGLAGGAIVGRWRRTRVRGTRVPGASESR